jgi:hypothetical protein
MYRWINETGETITTKSLKEFATTYAVRDSIARSLACGSRTRYRQWCSTSPRAKKQRQRFTTTLVNTKTGQKCLLGRSVKHFARQHGLCFNELSKLINHRKILYRGWCLEKTLELASGNLADAK